MDPIHSWDHLEEACFWKEHPIAGNGHYASIYAPGTRIVLPPLVMALLGETLVCPGFVDGTKAYNLKEKTILWLWILQRLVLLVADAIGAWSLYRYGKRLIHLEGQTNEAEMERETVNYQRMLERRENGDKQSTTTGEKEPLDPKNNFPHGDVQTQFVIPGVLRPARGWIFGFASKVARVEKCHGDDAKYILDSKSPDYSNEKGGQNENSNSKDEQEDLVEINYSACNKKSNDSFSPVKNVEASGTNPSNATLMSAKTKNKPPNEPFLYIQQLPMLTALLYFFNPISAIANSVGSLRGIWDAFFLLSLQYAASTPFTLTKEGIPNKVPSASKTALCLAFVTYADMAYAMFLMPILLWRGFLRSEPFPTDKSKKTFQSGLARDWKTVLGLYVFYLACLHLLASSLVGGDWNEYGKVVLQSTLPNIAFLEQDGSGSYSGPNMGLHWYFFVQMFDRFRPYFVVFINGVPSMFLIPLMIRLHRYPSAFVASVQLLWAIYRPINTVQTLTLALHLVLLNPRTIVRMKNPSLVSIFALPVPILLFVTFHRMWLVTGNGNPNYIYFQCVAYCVFVSIITIEFIGASVKRDKVRRLVEKGDTIKYITEGEKKVGSEVKGCSPDTLPKSDVISESKAIEEVATPPQNGEEEEVDISENYEVDETPEPNVVFL